MNHINSRDSKNNTIKSGSRILFLGEEYPVVEKPYFYSIFNGNVFYIRPDWNDDKIAEELISFYKEKALELLPQFVHKFEALMGVKASKVGITSAVTRWGSCSSTDNINFSWRIMLADKDTIEYVVVHELAHISIKSHNKDFWAEVEKYKPNFRVNKQKLKNLATRMSSENWD